MSEYSETLECCTQILMKWFFNTIGGKYTQGTQITHDPEIADIFISQMLLKKFEVFDINIQLPDELLLMLAVCTDGNPGKTQIVLKELLLSIKSKKGPIKPGYIIEQQDFVKCFPIQFPIMSNETINKKFEKLWDGQKNPSKSLTLFSDNLCDTPDWWLEVMK